MIDSKALRQDPEDVARALARKRFTLDVAQYRALEERRKGCDVESQSLQAARNQASKRIGELVREGVPVDEAKARAGREMEEINSALERVREEGEVIHAELDAFLAAIPNLPDADVPEGAAEEQNVEVRAGASRAPSTSRRATTSTSARAARRWISTRGAKLTGCALRGAARPARAAAPRADPVHAGPAHPRARLPRSYVPYLVNADSLRGTGQLPKFAAGPVQARRRARTTT